MEIDHRLATYGSLAPGKTNHHLLSDLRGDWKSGIVSGKLVEIGWGAALGFPALRLSDDGDDVAVHIFVSPDLPDHWDRLDAFEGTEYKRTQVRVRTTGGHLDAWIYLAADQDQSV